MQDTGATTQAQITLNDYGLRDGEKIPVEQGPPTAEAVAEIAPFVPLFACNEVVPALRNNELYTSFQQFAVWGVLRGGKVPLFWQMGSLAALAACQYSLADTEAKVGWVGAAIFAALSEASLVLISRIGSDWNMQDRLIEAACWGTANFFGAFVWQPAANYFLKPFAGAKNFTYSMIPRMIAVGFSAAATFSTSLAASKLAVRQIMGPSHRSALNTRALIQEVGAFSYGIVLATDAGFCAAAAPTFLNFSGELGKGHDALVAMKMIGGAAGSGFLAASVAGALAMTGYYVTFGVAEPCLTQWKRVSVEDVIDPSTLMSDVKVDTPLEEEGNGTNEGTALVPQKTTLDVEEDASNLSRCPSCTIF